LIVIPGGARNLLLQETEIKQIPGAYFALGMTN